MYKGWPHIFFQAFPPEKTERTRVFMKDMVEGLEWVLGRKEIAMRDA